MNRIRVLVEGDTEASFVNSILCPEFALKGIFLSPTLFRKRHKGSFGYQNCQKNILNSLKQEASVYVTMFVDFYKLPMDWPGKEKANQCRTYKDKAVAIENALSADICAQPDLSFNPTRFIPYVQMHEFEALLFSDTTVWAEHKISGRLEDIKKSFSCPEEINDNKETSPSHRILGVIKKYDKKFDGIVAAQKIGLAKMRSACPHFNEWITKLEKLGNQ